MGSEPEREKRRKEDKKIRMKKQRKG